MLAPGWQDDCVTTLCLPHEHLHMGVFVCVFLYTPTSPLLNNTYHCINLQVKVMLTYLWGRGSLGWLPLPFPQGFGPLLSATLVTMYSTRQQSSKTHLKRLFLHKILV